MDLLVHVAVLLLIALLGGGRFAGCYLLVNNVKWTTIPSYPNPTSVYVSQPWLTEGNTMYSANVLDRTRFRPKWYGEGDVGFMCMGDMTMSSQPTEGDSWYFLPPSAFADQLQSPYAYGGVVTFFAWQYLPLAPSEMSQGNDVVRIRLGVPKSKRHLVVSRRYPQPVTGNPQEFTIPLMEEGWTVTHSYKAFFGSADTWEEPATAEIFREALFDPVPGTAFAIGGDFAVSSDRQWNDYGCIANVTFIPEINGVNVVVSVTTAGILIEVVLDAVGAVVGTVVGGCIWHASVADGADSPDEVMTSASSMSRSITAERWSAPSSKIA
ncbi:hypothetical protein CBR_g9106 [Chara braunii]|uniref:Uncharacterized protein n=1 Tax=Chara braunii TaxID=69332 RepID=A0A388KP30_CHABU|nr:hypothetical protein CBR_g9106 [Chara braunii]|eukprot:GBG71693.1 hypothetical protein CBR_g9106 [Chara braunii]